MVRNVHDEPRITHTFAPVAIDRLWEQPKECMLKYIIRRLFFTLPVVVAVILLVFSMGFYAAGDPIEIRYGEAISRADPEVIATIRHNYGLDRPFLIQFADYLVQLGQGDFGRSLVTRKPVIESIGVTLPVTMQLSFWAFVLMAVLGIPLGILAALNANTRIDHLIVGSALMLRATPHFVIAPILLILLVIVLKLIPPPFGWKGMFHFNALLPSFLLGTWPLAIVVRQARAGVLEVLKSDYVRTAHAKGLPVNLVVSRHILRNAMLPVVTQLGLLLNGLIVGSVFIERLFALPGFGELIVVSVNRRDYPLIVGSTIIATMFVIGSNLLVDLIYPILDPRVRLD